MEYFVFDEISNSLSLTCFIISVLLVHIVLGSYWYIPWQMQSLDWLHYLFLDGKRVACKRIISLANIFFKKISTGSFWNYFVVYLTHAWAH